MTAPAPLRLRCPKDSPRAADRHLAIDVRLPLPIGPALSQLSRLRCHCGEELVIDTRATKAASADTEDRRIADTEDRRIAALEHALRSLCDRVAYVDDARVECDVCCGGMEGHTASCPVGHALRVLNGGER